MFERPHRALVRGLRSLSLAERSGDSHRPLRADALRRTSTAARSSSSAAPTCRRTRSTAASRSSASMRRRCRTISSARWPSAPGSRGAIERSRGSLELCHFRDPWSGAPIALRAAAPVRRRVRGQRAPVDRAAVALSRSSARGRSRRSGARELRLLRRRGPDRDPLRDDRHPPRLPRRRRAGRSASSRTAPTSMRRASARPTRRSATSSTSARRSAGRASTRSCARSRASPTSATAPRHLRLAISRSSGGRTRSSPRASASPSASSGSTRSRSRSSPRWRQHALVSVAPLTDSPRNVIQGCAPLKIVESMASGAAVVASDVPPVRELIRDRHDGWLVHPDRPAELARAMRILLDHPDLAASPRQQRARTIERALHVGARHRRRCASALRDQFGKECPPMNAWKAHRSLTAEQKANPEEERGHAEPAGRRAASRCSSRSPATTASSTSCARPSAAAARRRSSSPLVGLFFIFVIGEIAGDRCRRGVARGLRRLRDLDVALDEGRRPLEQPPCRSALPRAGRVPRGHRPRPSRAPAARSPAAAGARKEDSAKSAPSSRAT